MSVDILGKNQLDHYTPFYINLGNTLLWLDNKNAQMICRKCLTSLTPTAITYDNPPLNLHDAINAKFNGTTAKVDCLAQLLGSGALTIVAWVNPTDFGAGNVGRICDNGKTILRVNTTNSLFQFTSDGSTYVSAAASSISTGVFQMVAVTRDAAGAANFYLNGVLSGTAGQASGTPANGTTNLIIGNNSAASAGFKGYIGLFMAFNIVLTAADIGFIYTNTD